MILMKKIITLALSCLLASAASAQSQPKQSITASFEEFRRGVLDRYQEFRHTVLEHYADFLEGKWHEYEPLEPMTKTETPKPVKVPSVNLSKPSTTPVKMPDPKLADIPKVDIPAPDPAPQPGEPKLPPSPFDTPKAETPPEAIKEIPLTLNVRPDMGAPVLGVSKTPLPVIPPMEEETESTPVEEEDMTGKEVVDFYGMQIAVPMIDFKISESLDKVSDFARHWKTLDEQDAAEKIEEALMPVMDKLGLNDYLKFEFLCAYMDSKFPNSGKSPKMSAVHYMLANLGFNARIAVATKSGDPIILIPAEQKLYAVTYMNLGGENFYVLGGRNANLAGSTLATCDLPKGASSGKKFNMLIDGLNLPRKDRQFDVNHGDMHLSGKVNENLMPVVYRYPQMSTGEYAKCVLDKDLRESLVDQVKQQLGGKDMLKATDELLQFVQSGFQYATDDDFHGFEKPYFLEENLYYPKNDCEDRAIFYTYLLWNALGVENHLLAFPGHESASVSLPGKDVKGTSYSHNGKTFFISDPTYLGSNTGMCMRQFETTPPTIDYVYSK